MKIKKTQIFGKINAPWLIAVMLTAVLVVLKLDASMQVYAANSAVHNIAQSMETMPQNPCIPVFGTVTSPFGERVNPISNKEEFHKGVDIAAAEGTPIQLILDGTVVEVGENDIYGRYILVEHADKLYTRYCHCSRILAETGYNLKKGELIALVGSTGWSTGPHLHLEVIADGKYCDPEWLLEW